MRLLVFLFFMPMFALAQSVAFELAYSGYQDPVDISDPEDGTDRLFITDRRGVIEIIENGVQLSQPFLDISTKVLSGGERGLLGLVFHPDYENNGFFFVNYIEDDGARGRTVIARYSVSSEDPNIADQLSEKRLMTITQPFSNHNAGDLNFSPIDGYLYIAMGDGGSGGDPGCRAQKMNTFHGKILRLDVDQNINQPPYYGIPSGNMQNEIWALGLRNPWRVSFDRLTGDLWIADVGQGKFEEINRIPAGTVAGTNFGWKRMEANDCYSGGSSGCGTTSIPPCESDDYTDPIYEIPHFDGEGTLLSTEGNSITGGYVYRGCKYPSLQGKYICTDYVTRNSFLIDHSTGTANLLGQGPSSVSTYGEDRHGELWVASLNGQIYKVVDPNVTKQLILSSSDFPLSGTYRATESITINDPINQNLSGVKFITEKIQMADDVTIPQGSILVTSDDFCEE